MSEISVTYKLELGHWSVVQSYSFSDKLMTSHGISIDISHTGICRITTSRATFSVADIEDLPEIIADDLNGQLLTYTDSILTSELDEPHRSRIFKDELEGMIRVDLDTVLE